MNAQSAKQFNRYQILEELGRGGMGAVYKAYDTKLKTIIALKVITHDSQEYLQRFFLEVATIAKLNHPNIVRFYEYGSSPRPFFTMEYIEGVTLSYLVGNKNILPQDLVDLLIPICEALHYAHSQSVIHRDIKPSNIIITKDKLPKIMDFGLAKQSNQTQRLSKSGQMLGTVYYMAPEQVEGKTTFASDIYSLGASMYEALTYRTVYQGESEINIIVQIIKNTPIPLRHLNPDISPYLEAICLKCLKRNFHKRYKDFEQLARELKNFKAHRPLIARKYNSWDVMAHFIHKHKVICSSIALVFLILFCSLLVTINALNYAHQERKKAQQAAQRTQQEKDKTKAALNKVMAVLSYAVRNYAQLQNDEKFASLFSKIFEDVESYGENEDWSFIKGYVTAQSGDKQKSIAYYTQKIEKTPNDSGAYNNRGTLYQQLQKYDLAEWDYSKAILFSPTDINAYNNRAILYHQRQKYALAIADYSKIIALAPQIPKAYNNRGLIYEKLGKYDLARTDYTKAIAVAPNYLEAYNNRGNLYKNQKKYTLAMADYHKTILLAPQNADVYNNRGLIYEKLKKYKRAIRDYNKAIALDPKHKYAYSHRAKLYNKLNQPTLAQSDYNQAILLNPKNPNAYNNRALFYEKQRRYKHAIADYNKAIFLNPNAQHIYYNRASLYYQQKEYTLAMQDYSKAIILNPKDSNSYHNRGILYYQQNKYTLAIKDFHKAISIEPNKWRSHRGLYLCYTAINNTQKAQYHLQISRNLRK
ncbi:serine/threonine-protein kinase [Candidatus Uabimicrobium amorphum]|uniref:Protein kinase domain-containing protein n=1 Tax=Uabimicrobium amorphum TaxID=2596890 RepID=A0A5S9IQ14_UABAM|nr:serine/threonine-protein kinase [Candidatus Uabimicrobium amorphum]BBM85993.1 hypothetical protein UABAM_04379 [Candidatus Uabimicrobium amorphum]